MLNTYLGYQDRINIGADQLFIPREVEIIEVGPRDGLQNEPIAISTEQKKELMLDLLKLDFPEWKRHHLFIRNGYRKWLILKKLHVL